MKKSRRRRRVMRIPSFCSTQTVPMRVVKTHQRPNPLFSVRQRRARWKNKRCVPLITMVQRYSVSSSHAFHIWHVFLQLEPATAFTVKLRGVPFNVKEVITKGGWPWKSSFWFGIILHILHFLTRFLWQLQIREFMTPLKPAAIRIGRNDSGNRTGRLLFCWMIELENSLDIFLSTMLIFFRICVCGLTLCGTSGSSLEEE